MKRSMFIGCVLIFFSTLSLAEPAARFNDGFVRQDSQGNMQAFSLAKKRWVSVEQFWSDYVTQRTAQQQGFSWGRSSDYPEYEQVKEFDTLLILLPQGSCLMEFFHGRWRRANDVRRWHDAMNQYGGCPFVFD